MDRRRAVPVGAVAAAALLAGSSSGQAPPSGPENHLPPNITRLTAAGERAAWSPDGRRVAYISRTFGQAIEVDLRTRVKRVLTGRFANAGFLRVQYLPNGDYLLIGPRVFRDPDSARFSDAELWVLDRRARRPPVRLGQKVEEGVAISRRRPLIAWMNTARQYPGRYAAGESVISMARIVYGRGVPRLSGRRVVLRHHAPQCGIEPQDFRRHDRELIFTCYRQDGAAVMGVDLRSHRVTAYRSVPGEYNEAEGIAPSGRWIAVESGHGQLDKPQTGAFIDVWKLRLRPHSRDFVRLTRWGLYPNYKASNPVVSPDGRTVAFQSARSNEPAGVGHGIFLLRLPGERGHVARRRGIQSRADVGRGRR